MVGNPFIRETLEIFLQITFLQGTPDDTNYFEIIKGFGQVIMSAYLHGLDSLMDICKGRDEDYRQILIQILDLLQAFHAVKPGHADIQEDRVRLRDADSMHRLVPIRGQKGLETLGLDDMGQDLADFLLIINDKNVRNHLGHLYPPLWSTGRLMG